MDFPTRFGLRHSSPPRKSWREVGIVIDGDAGRSLVEDPGARPDDLVRDSYAVSGCGGPDASRRMLLILDSVGLGLRTETRYRSPSPTDRLNCGSPGATLC